MTLYARYEIESSRNTVQLTYINPLNKEMVKRDTYQGKYTKD